MKVIVARIKVEDEKGRKWVEAQLNYIEDEGHDRALMGEHGEVSVEFHEELERWVTRES